MRADPPGADPPPPGTPVNPQLMDSLEAEGISAVLSCDTMIFGTAEGTVYTEFPPEVGILIGQKNRYLVLEVHVDNPTQIKGTVEITDLIRIYTASKLRQYNGGTMIIGDPMAQLLPLKTGETDVLRVGTCSSACTKTFKGPVTVFRNLLHMHKTGKRIWTTQKRPGENASIFDAREFFHFGFQVLTPLRRVIQPGDQLNVNCIYDTTKSTGSNVSFGQASDKEMCQNFLLFYPVENAFKFCGHVSGIGTMCGGSPRPRFDIIYEVQPIPDGFVGYGNGLDYKEPFGVATGGKPKVPASWLSEPEPTSDAMKTGITILLVVAVIFGLL